MPNSAQVSEVVTVLPADPAPVTSISIPPFQWPTFKVGLALNFALPTPVGAVVLPVAWTATGLPPGASLSADGHLTGTPTAEQTGPITFSVKDSAP